MPDAYIYDALRTPRGKGKSSGSLYTVPPVRLLSGALAALQERTGLDTTLVDDVVTGCVTQTGEQGACIARFAALQAGYDVDAPGVTVNRFCGSGLEAVNHAATMVASGFFDCVVASGVESMSRVKMGTDGGAIWDVSQQWERGSVPQGISADLLATMRGITRADADAFAVASQERAAAAIESGAFARSIVPVVDENGLPILEVDEHPRAGTTTDKLAGLQPAFQIMGEQFGLDVLVRKQYPHIAKVHHIHHAGNSSGIVDGAAAVLIGNDELGTKLGRKPRARIKSMSLVAEEPLLMLTGPMPAARKALAKAGMALSDIDLFEVNEAFAAVVAHLHERARTSTTTGSTSTGAPSPYGHPLGATGAMLLGTCTRRPRGPGAGHRRSITLCIGGGMGIATIIERV